MTTSTQELLFAHQPIFNAGHQVIGSELLYRSGIPERADFSNADNATAATILNVCSSLYDEDESDVPDGLLFINVTTNLLESDSLYAFNKEHVVFEVNLNDARQLACFNALKLVRSRGYRLALGDFNFSSNNKKILDIASFVKVDTSGSSFQEDAERFAVLKSLGKKLAYEKVESLESFEQCAELGFDFFQGYYLEKPHLNHGKKINSDGKFALELINKLNQSDVGFEEISYLVARDPRLSFQLLKILNSPAQGQSRTITSLKQAVIYLGIDNLKKWAVPITMVNASSSPFSLFQILLTRAKTCEMFAIHKSWSEPEKFFTTGLLSGIDAIFKVPMTVRIPQSR